MAKYVELTKENFKETIDNGVSLVDFWASWCGPCRMIAPIIDELAIQFEGRANICKVDVDTEQELSQVYGIRSIPTIIFIKDGNVVDTMIGVKSREDLANRLEELIK